MWLALLYVKFWIKYKNSISNVGVKISKEEEGNISKLSKLKISVWSKWKKGLFQACTSACVTVASFIVFG